LSHIHPRAYACQHKLVVKTQPNRFQDLQRRLPQILSDAEVKRVLGVTQAMSADKLCQKLGISKITWREVDRTRIGRINGLAGLTDWQD